MIKVVYNRSFYRVTIEGHAGSGESGHDLVCASVSILAHTLAANVTQMEAAGQTNGSVIRLKRGDAEIQCRPLTRLRAPVKLVFDSICAGFQILAQNFPENISYEIHGA